MRLVAITLILGSALAAQAADRVFESGENKTHLLELFTSEGCSSCPPAEAWFSKLKSEPRLWKDFVPVEFHVDYWDQLGWKDPFATKEWTARQNQYSTEWGTDSVYTPGFVLDGRELRNRAVPAAAADKPGVLKVSIHDDKILAEFHPVAGKAMDVDVYVAALGFDLTKKVAAGENSGRDLRHDFVVLSLMHKRMIDGRAELEISKTDSANGALVAWVTQPDSLDPIQAVGGWIKSAR